MELSYIHVHFYQYEQQFEVHMGTYLANELTQQSRTFHKFQQNRLTAANKLATYVVMHGKSSCKSYYKHAARLNKVMVLTYIPDDHEKRKIGSVSKYCNHGRGSETASS